MFRRQPERLGFCGVSVDSRPP